MTCGLLPSDGGTAPAAHPITARHLLTHTAGRAYGYDGDSAVDRPDSFWTDGFARRAYGYDGDSAVDRLYRRAGLIDDWDYLAQNTRELVEKLADIPLLHQPGTRWHLQNARFSRRVRMMPHRSSRTRNKASNATAPWPSGATASGFTSSSSSVAWWSAAKCAMARIAFTAASTSAARRPR